MAKADVGAIIQQGLQFHNAGQLQQAETMYRRALQADENNADALHLLGVISYQVGRLPAAQELIARAIKINPSNAAYHNNLGEVYRTMNRLELAEASYRKAVELSPLQADAWSNLALIHAARGESDQAAASARRALSINPNHAPALVQLGDAIVATSPEEAFAAWNRSIQINPRQPNVLANLGCLLGHRGHYQQAIAACSQALTLDPNSAPALIHLSFALASVGELQKAIEAVQRAIQLNPNLGDAWGNLGFILDRQNRVSELPYVLTQAARLRPNYAEGWKNLGVAHYKMGQFTQAEEAYRKSIEIDPNHAEGHVNLATALLLKGDFEHGWEEYEWRWKLADFSPRSSRNIVTPWTGQDLTGKSIALLTEQGSGDTFQFIRYATLLADRGAKVIATVQAGLEKLCETVPGVASVVTMGGPEPEADFQAHMLGLPRQFKTNVETIPANVPYIMADPAIVEQWKARMEADGPGIRVGLCWGGAPGHAHNRTRSTTLAALGLLAQVPGVIFYSLQRGEAAAQALTPPAGMKLIDHPQQTNFSETAGLMANLDLTITIDTSVAHLGGAMGLPIWTMLCAGVDFRWLRDREDSPWYPTMRLIRQARANEWEPVVGRVKAELEAFVAKKSAPSS